ncbi:MAG: DUF615 domain-containing protein [Gammaproteobacteria bacterium]|nr:MAG: DUF615 domain-containing protein [Gammaproteobacteria bacterium]
MNDDTPLLDRQPSRSQRKRDHQALQALVESVVGLPLERIQRLDLPPEVHEAVLDARSQRRGAFRRQIRYIAKMIARSGIEGRLRDGFESASLEGRQNTLRLHRAEGWRDRLCDSGDDTLNAFVEAFPHADRQKLRQLQRRCRQAAQSEGVRHGARALFRYIHQVIDEEGATTAEPE